MPVAVQLPLAVVAVVTALPPPAPVFFILAYSLKLYRVGLLYCECVGGDGPPPPQRQECGAESVGPTREYLKESPSPLS